MRVESLSSRLDFSERRVRALEGVVQYRPEVVRGPDRRDEDDDEQAPAPQAPAGGSVEGFVPGGGAAASQARVTAARRRRRRRVADGAAARGAGCRRCPGARVRRCARGAQVRRRAQATSGASTATRATTIEDGGAMTADDVRATRRARRRGAARASDAPEPSRTGDARSRHPSHLTHPRLRQTPEPDPTTTSSEGRDRRSAVRRRHQRRRRAACSLCCRAPGEARPGRGADHVRASRLHLVEERAAAGHGDGPRHSGAPLPGGASSAIRSSSRSGRSRSSPQPHSLRDELAWLEAEGPTSPALIEHIKAHEADYDFFIFFSFRYHHSFHGCRAVASKAILVPTAERDGALGLGIYPPVFRGVRAFMYNSFEERALIQAVSNNQSVPGVVVGIGSEIPERSNAGALPPEVRHARSLCDLRRPHRREQGLRRAVRFLRALQRVARRRHAPGADRHAASCRFPKHPRIHHLGFVEDQDKYDAMAAAELLIMPSYLESLSMVALEAWAMGKPVLANAKCDVLQGQCIRSNAGLFYDELPGVRRNAARDRYHAEPAGRARPQRPRRSSSATTLAGDRAEVPRHARALSKEIGAAHDGAAAGLVQRAGGGSLPPADQIVKQLPTGPYREARRSRSSAAASGDRHGRSAPAGRLSAAAAARARDSGRRRSAPSGDRSAASADSAAISADQRPGQPRPRGRRSSAGQRSAPQSQQRPTRERPPQPQGGRRERQREPTSRQPRSRPRTSATARRGPAAAAAARGRPRTADEQTGCPRSTRSSRRSATATPSATRCWASSACCAAPATSRRSSSQTADPRLEDLTLRLLAICRRRAIPTTS